MKERTLAITSSTCQILFTLILGGEKHPKSFMKHPTEISNEFLSCCTLFEPYRMGQTDWGGGGGISPIYTFLVCFQYSDTLYTNHILIMRKISRGARVTLWDDFCGIWR